MCVVYVGSARVTERSLMPELTRPGGGLLPDQAANDYGTRLGGGDDDGVGGPANVCTVRELPTRTGDAIGPGISSDLEAPTGIDGDFLDRRAAKGDKPGGTGQAPGDGPPM